MPKRRIDKPQIANIAFSAGITPTSYEEIKNVLDDIFQHRQFWHVITTSAYADQGVAAWVKNRNARNLKAKKIKVTVVDMMWDEHRQDSLKIAYQKIINMKPRLVICLRGASELEAQSKAAGIETVKLPW